MINKDKIILMTKLAIYEKKHGERDKKANNYFRHDYIYWQNFWTRLCALLGCLIILGFYAIDKIFVNQADIFDLDYKAEGSTILLYVIGVMAVYTSISTFKATREYTKTQKRLNNYLGLIKKLDSFDNSTTGNKADRNLPEGDTSHYYGTGIRDKRDNN